MSESSYYHVPANAYQNPPPGMSTHSRWIALLLCLFLGVLGIHRFYVGKVWTGLLQMLTGGGFVVWTVIDFILILFGAFTDSEGRKLS